MSKILEKHLNAVNLPYNLNLYYKQTLFFIMVSALTKNEDVFGDEDLDVPYEKHKQLLETITSKTKRKYINCDFLL